MCAGDPGPATLDYEGDAPDGGCFVSCRCGQVFNEKDKEECPRCKKDLVFPNADW